MFVSVYKFHEISERQAKKCLKAYTYFCNLKRSTFNFLGNFVN